MKDKVLIVFAALLLSLPTMLQAQGEQEEVSTRIVSYIIIKGDKLKNVAVRFQVPVKSLKKLNKIGSKNFTVYPGLTLQIPVKTRPKVWDPSKEDMSDNGILSQDRRPSVDYEVIGEGFDYDIRDDFIATSDALDDSMQFEKVGTHMSKIDKRINLISYRMDSAKQAEFNFQNNESDLNSVLGRMKMARDKYYINGPLGREIDSLNRVKAKLANLRIRLRNRITEYEYLMDNVAYAKENYEKDEKNKDTHWGDQITYESNYAKSKARHEEQLVDLSPKPKIDTVKPQPKLVAKDTIAPHIPIAVVKDTIVPLPKPIVETKDTVTPPKPVVVIKDTTPAPKPVVIEPKQIAVAKDTIVKTAAAPPRSSPFSFQRVDIAPLVAKNSWIEIRHTYKHELIRLTAAELAADRAAPTAPSVKDTSTIIAVVKIDTIVPSIPKPLIDTIARIKALDTIVKPTISIAKDTVVKAVPAKPVIDTVHKATAVIAKKDTVTKPAPVIKQAPVVKPIPVIKAADTTRKAAPAAPKKDTAPAPVKSVKATVDTTHKTAIKTAPKDTTAITTQPVHVKDAIFTPPRITVDVAKVKDTTTAKPISTQDIDDSIADTQRLIALAKKPDIAKAPIAKSNPSVKDTATENATARAAQEKIAKAKKDAAAKPDQAKTAKKEPEVKPVVAKKPDEAPKPTPVVRIDSSKIKQEQSPLYTLSVTATNLEPTKGPLFALDLTYDSSMLYHEKKISLDPLASYKTDSNFVITTVQLKEIPILEIKNKPKYLIPVDSISQIKGEFYLIRARQVLEKGDFKEGDKFLRKSLELNPNNAATWMLHADLCLTTGAADKALKEYDISGQIDSSNPKVFYNIALLYAKANDEQKAYKFFSKATDVNDKYLLAYMGRASVLMDTRDYEGAILDYDKTLNINKYYSPAYKGRALAKMEAHKFSDAVTDFNQYLEIEDPDGYVLYERGIAKILSNNLLQGCLDLSSAMELGFKDAEKAIKKFCE